MCTTFGVDNLSHFSFRMQTHTHTHTHTRARARTRVHTVTDATDHHTHALAITDMGNNIFEFI